MICPWCWATRQAAPIIVGNEPERAQCRSCGAPVMWVANSTTGNIEPLDAEPREDGNIEFIPGHYTLTGKLMVRHLHKSELDTLPGIEQPARYVSHFATCPDAPQWRKNTNEQE